MKIQVAWRPASQNTSIYCSELRRASSLAPRSLPMPSSVDLQPRLHTKSAPCSRLGCLGSPPTGLSCAANLTQLQRQVQPACAPGPWQTSRHRGLQAISLLHSRTQEPAKPRHLHKLCASARPEGPDAKSLKTSIILTGSGAVVAQENDNCRCGHSIGKHIHVGLAFTFSSMIFLHASSTAEAQAP